jgi:hypothetical protein
MRQVQAARSVRYERRQPMNRLRARMIYAGVVLAVAVGAGATAIAFASRGPTVAQAAPSIPPIPSAPTRVAPDPTPAPSPTSAPTDPLALADGTYPVFVRGVDVRAATVTADVLQTFFGADARRAAAEDGVPWGQVKYDPVYIRNENPRLRTLPVAPAVRIELIGACEEPDRTAGLRQLRTAARPFEETFYYDVSVIGGVIEEIVQRIAIPAC